MLEKPLTFKFNCIINWRYSLQPILITEIEDILHLYTPDSPPPLRSRGVCDILVEDSGCALACSLGGGLHQVTICH